MLQKQKQTTHLVPHAEGCPHVQFFAHVDRLLVMRQIKDVLRSGHFWKYHIKYSAEEMGG